jgi:hypothetical protein
MFVRIKLAAEAFLHDGQQNNFTVYLINLASTHILTPCRMNEQLTLLLNTLIRYKALAQLKLRTVISEVEDELFTLDCTL